MGGSPVTLAPGALGGPMADLSTAIALRLLHFGPLLQGHLTLVLKPLHLRP